MPKLSRLGDRRSLTINYDEDIITVVFRPRAINSVWLDRALGLGDDDREGHVRLICEALISWDITDDDGRELPPTPELMRSLPIDLLSQIRDAIMESVSPKQRSE